MAISDWYPILNWANLPNFGFCHTITDVEEFKKNFVETEPLLEFRKNLLETLNGSFESHFIRILGKPGSGKTTFLYSLIRMNGSGAKNNLLDKYYIYVFHVNKARAEDPEPYVMDQFLIVWNKYLTDAGLGHIFESINSQTLDIKLKLSRCNDFFLANKDKFKKVLIVALDDVDLLEPRTMRGIIVASISHLEAASIKKWLFIREETFDKYDPETKRLISQFFPEARPFPQISLFDVVQHRIKNTSGTSHALNPFPASLCDHVQATYDDCLRESLPALKAILENRFPTGFHQNQAIEFIQNYLEKAGIAVLIRSNRLPNLHASAYRTVPYPISLDMLALMAFIQDETLLIGAANHAINARRHRINAKYKDEEIKLQRNQFGYSLEAIIKAGLAIREKNAVFLTALGRSIASYCGKKFYSEACFSAILNTRTLSSKEYTDEYQLMSFVEIDHEEIARIWTTAVNFQ